LIQLKDSLSADVQGLKSKLSESADEKSKLAKALTEKDQVLRQLIKVNEKLEQAKAESRKV